MQGFPTSGSPTIVKNYIYYYFWENMILPHPYQPPLSNLKTREKNNLSFSSAQIRMGQGTSSYHHLFPSPTASFLSCDILLISNLGLYNRPHPNFRLGLLLHLHTIFNSDSRLDHGGLGGGEGYQIANSVENS